MGTSRYLAILVSFIVMAACLSACTTGVETSASECMSIIRTATGAQSNIRLTRNVVAESQTVELIDVYCSASVATCNTETASIIAVRADDWTVYLFYGTSPVSPPAHSTCYPDRIDF